MSDDWKDRATPVASDWRTRATRVDAQGEPGNPGPDLYKESADALQPKGPSTPDGNVIDAARTWADTAALGAGPQIEGAMGAVAHALVDPMQRNGTDLDAYRYVRDEGKKQHDLSANTTAGQAVKPLGALSTPIPIKALGPEASAGAQLEQAAKVGGGMGGLQALANSKSDMTKMDWENLRQGLLDTAIGTGAGVAGGLASGGLMTAIAGPAQSMSRKLPMDILGVSEPARRSMVRQGIYDSAGDDLLSLVRPFRSGMRKGSLTEDALSELDARGKAQGDVVSGLDKASGNTTAQPDVMREAIERQAQPFTVGSLQDKQVAARMNKEAKNLTESLGDKPISLADAESFKQRFGAGAAKLLRHAGEPAAKTQAMGETYSALKNANEAAAEAVAQSLAPHLTGKFVPAKQAYARLAAPLEGANVERSGLGNNDFSLGELLSDAPEQGSMMQKMTEGLPFAGLIKTPLDIGGRAYGRGLTANIAELLAKRGPVNGATLGSRGAESLGELLRDDSEKKHPWASMTTSKDDEETK